MRLSHESIDRMFHVATETSPTHTYFCRPARGGKQTVSSQLPPLYTTPECPASESEPILARFPMLLRRSVGFQVLPHNASSSQIAGVSRWLPTPSRSSRLHSLHITPRSPAGFQLYTHNSMLPNNLLVCSWLPIVTPQLRPANIMLGCPAFR
jgi:hypothetical protein